MGEEAIRAAVIRALRTLGCQADQILPVHELQSDLGVDSTELVELSALIKNEVVMMEKRVSLLGVNTVDDVVQRIKNHVG